MTIPYICMSAEQLGAKPDELKAVLVAFADQARNTIQTHKPKASKEDRDGLLIAAAQLSYLGQRMNDQVLRLEAREAIRKLKANDPSMPDAVIDMFNNDDIMPDEEQTMVEPDSSSLTVDKSKSDVEQTWATIQSYVNKIKDAIKKLNERINKQIHENLRTYMKTGKITASQNLEATMPKVKKRRAKAVKKVKAPKQATKVTAAELKIDKYVDLNADLVGEVLGYVQGNPSSKLGVTLSSLLKQVATHLLDDEGQVSYEDAGYETEEEYQEFLDKLKSFSKKATVKISY